MSKRFDKEFSSQPRKDGPPSYIYEEERRNPETSFYYQGKSLYDTADECEYFRIFEPAQDDENHLETIKNEIQVRVKITKQEIFKIGELLVYAKDICQKQGTKFQEWVEENFDFSYETAHNFMNVFQNCLGHREVALNMKASVLYKISAPSFPDELREYLFEQGNIEEITNGKLKEMVRKYKEGGFEAVKDDIEEYCRAQTVIKQTSYSLDMAEDALRKLTQLQSKMHNRGSSIRQCVDYETLCESDESVAFQINMRLSRAIQTAIDTLKQAKEESEDILSDVSNHVANGIVE